jgi:hypothetical protein
MVGKSAQGSTSGRRLRSDSLETSKAMYVLPFDSRPPAGLLELERGLGHSSLGARMYLDMYWMAAVAIHCGASGGDSRVS